MEVELPAKKKEKEKDLKIIKKEDCIISTLQATCLMLGTAW